MHMSRSRTSMMSHGEWGVLVAEIMGMTSLSLHFLGSMWSSVRNVLHLSLFFPRLWATSSTASSSMLRNIFTTMTPLLVR